LFVLNSVCCYFQWIWYQLHLRVDNWVLKLHHRIMVRVDNWVLKVFQWFMLTVLNVTPHWNQGGTPWFCLTYRQSKHTLSWIYSESFNKLQRLIIYYMIYFFTHLTCLFTCLRFSILYVAITWTHEIIVF
jgi:hypothetical protein